MPKATLEFNLPEEREEFDLAVKGCDYASALRDVDNAIRNWLKHGHTFTGATAALDAVRCAIREQLADRDLNL